MSLQRRTLLSSFGREGDVQEYLDLAHELSDRGDLRLAATAYDRAYGLAPSDQSIRRRREDLLDHLAVVEHGITFRYVPAGSFLMGYSGGDIDERPVHVVELGDYWIADVPMSWALYCDLMGWQPAPIGYPYPSPEPASAEERDVSNAINPTGLPKKSDLSLFFANAIRLQYCENGTLRATDWHAHVPDYGEDGALIGQGVMVSSGRFWGEPERSDPGQPWGYRLKPMVAVGIPEVAELGKRLSSETVTYRLPTEAEWEKAARGGLIDSKFPWGDEPPSPDRCDFDRFEQFSVQPMRRFPPNAYGLYAMSGGVWEWTADWYDAAYYGSGPASNPTGPETGTDRVIRGGSWADCAEVLRVSFRASCPAATSMDQRHSRGNSANIGFRLCRIDAASDP